MTDTVDIYGGPRQFREHSEAVAPLLADRLKALVTISVELAWPQADPSMVGRLCRHMSELSISFGVLAHRWRPPLGVVPDAPPPGAGWTCDDGPFPMRFQHPQAFRDYSIALAARGAELDDLGKPAVNDCFVVAFYCQHLETMLVITSPKANAQEVPCPTQISIPTSKTEPTTTPTPSSSTKPPGSLMH